MRTARTVVSRIGPRSGLVKGRPATVFTKCRTAGLTRGTIVATEVLFPGRPILPEARATVATRLRLRPVELPLGTRFIAELRFLPGSFRTVDRKSVV